MRQEPWSQRRRSRSRGTPGRRIRRAVHIRRSLIGNPREAYRVQKGDTKLLKAGVHPEVVSERLDHASIGITLDAYSHVMPGMQEEAAEKIDAGLRAALAG